MSPARTKKKARRATRRPAKRATARKPARKTATRKSAKRKPARRTAASRRSAAKRTAAARRNGSRPKRAAVLKLVKRANPRARAAKPARQPRPPAFAGAVASASARDLALFDLVRARVEVQAAIQGMVAASAEVPTAEGKWNPRQIVLHLHYWDREMLPWVEKAFLHDQRPPHTHDDILAANVTSQQELGAHDWDSARRLMQQSREALLEALQSLPEEPATMWSSEHAVGWLVRMLSHHDRHHAGTIKEARSRRVAEEVEQP